MVFDDKNISFNFCLLVYNLRTCLENFLCLFLAPEGLYIIQDAKVFGANQPMQFELVQVTVSYH